MTTYLFCYRMPASYQPGNPDVAKKWGEWFAGMGDALIDRGNPVFESSTLGQADGTTQLGGYSLVRAETLDAALALAAGCPVPSSGCGVEVGVLTPLAAGAAA